MVVAIVGLYLVFRLTGILQRFSIPSGSSQPTLQQGSHIWVSNLVSPKRFDHIVYWYNDSITQQKQHYVFRLCGMPGDTIEIKNGDLYVNNQNTSGMFDLCLEYQVNPNDGARLSEVLKLDEYDFMMMNDKAELILSKKQLDEARKLKISVERKIIPKEKSDEYISRIYGKPWNLDHFGPLIIPANRYFVLGDNRHRAQDSRYTGLVPISDFYGTVLGK
jgi:signal peptidase I